MNQNREIITKITPEQQQKYNQKIEQVKKYQEQILSTTVEYKKKELRYELLNLCDDVSVFAYLNLIDKSGKPYKLFSYQDLIVNEKNKNVIVAKGRKIGATDIISILILHRAMFNENYTVVVASKTQDMARRIIDRVRMFLVSCPTTYKNIVGDVDNKFEIWIKNAGKKTYSPIISVVAGESARGVDADLLVVDEAAFIGEGTVQNADYIYREILAPTISAHDGQTFLISTPPKQPIGFFWEAFNSSYWKKYHFPSKICPLITPNFLGKMKDEMTHAAFRREYLGEFFADSSTYFSEQEIRDATQDYIIPVQSEQQEFIGIDWGETLSNSARVHVIKQEDEVKVINIVEYPLKTDFAYIIKEINDIYTRKPNLQVLADAGVGRGQISVMKDMQLPVQEYSFGGTKKGDLYTELKILFEKRKVKIPDHKQLINELSVYLAEYNPLTQRTRYHQPKESKVSDHVLDAFALACFCAMRMNQRVSLEFLPTEKKDIVQNSTKTAICTVCDEYFQTNKATTHFQKLKCPKHSA